MTAVTTTVTLHTLHIGQIENGVAEVGRVDTGVFIELGVEGVDLVRWVGEGLALDEVRRLFTERYGTEPDLDDFLEGMASCGFVKTEATPVADEAPRRGIALLAGVPQHRVAWLLSWPMAVLYYAVWLAVPAALVLWPSLLPLPSDALLLDRVLTNALVIAVIAWTLVLLHEGAHAISVRALGVTGRLSVSRRMWFLVAQTEMSGIRSVPRRARYAPYLAGLTWDLTLVTSCFALELAGIGGQLVRTIAYTLTLAIIYQFLIFMRTDLYFVLGNWLRLGDLMGDTRRWLANLALRLLGRPPRHDLGDVPARELRVIRWYAPFYLLGSLAVTAALVLLTLPAMKTMLTIAFSGLGRGISDASFWDGLGFLALVALQLGTFGWVIATERRQA